MLKPIVISEFPKSGGSWIVSMLGDALDLPCRDIYMRPGFDLFDAFKHPWYRDSELLDFPAQCVVKSHELPGSPAIDFEFTQIHLVRDGRDVAVSKYFFEKDFCVRNGITASFEEDFDAFIERTSREWADYVTRWNAQPETLTITYEAFLANPALELGALIAKLIGTQFVPRDLENVVARYTREKFSASLDPAFKHNSFVRKGIVGDWRNYFSPENVTAFKVRAGAALSAFGYEENDTWCL